MGRGQYEKDNEMPSPFDIPPLSRRAFAKYITASVAVGTALAHPAPSLAQTQPAEDKTRKVYSFYPLENGALTPCKSCLSHAQHKRFATLEAADTNRAHPGCNCSILEETEPADTYYQLFGGTGDAVDRLVYDLRQVPAS
jgi:hypothetical protein